MQFNLGFGFLTELEVLGNELESWSKSDSRFVEKK